jgi:hypothetical protein
VLKAFRASRSAAWGGQRHGAGRTTGNLISAGLHAGRPGQLAIAGLAAGLAMLRAVCHHDHFAA